MQRLHAQQARLDKLESEWKHRPTSRNQADEAEIKLKQEKENPKVQQLQVVREVKVAAAWLRVYNAMKVLMKKLTTIPFNICAGLRILFSQRQFSFFLSVFYGIKSTLFIPL